MDTIPPLDSARNLSTPETTFIYALVDPETNEVRYIGKANNPQERYKRHLRKDEDHFHKTHWINKLRSQGLKPTLQILEEVPYAHWGERERYWIAFYRAQGCQLTNLAEGGKGGNPGPETRAKIAAWHIGRPSPTKGVKRGPSPLRGVKRPPYSDEWKAKIGNGNRGKKRTPEQRAVKSAQLTGRPVSPETRAKIAASNTGKKLSPEHRAKLSAARRKRIITDETRKKLSEAGKRRYPKGAPVCPPRKPVSNTPTLWDQLA